MVAMKDIESRLISELMKNSRRSDRELAKVIGVSQPTVSRMIKRLEEEGIIKEYTIIPDFNKLGYEIMGFTFVKMKQNLNSNEQKEFREFVSKFAKEHPHAELIGVSGMGLNKDHVFVSFYKDYSTYVETQRLSREVPYSDVNELEGFLVNLKEKSQERVLTMSALAKDVLIREKEKP
jgi:DNA-binding Lrp family transcriptional regulator